MNFGPAQDHIIAHLQARLSAAPATADIKVCASEELAAVEERSQHTPALHVIFNGYRVAELSHRGHAARVVYSFLVVAAARCARGAGQGTAAQLKAADIASAAATHLMGLSIPACSGALLQLVTAPGAIVAAGFVYIPLAFEVSATVRGHPDNTAA